MTDHAPTVTEHHLKTWPEHFQDVIVRRKTFEIRINDRGYDVGHVLVLQEYDPLLEQYTGRVSRHLVTYLIGNKMGLEPGYVCKERS